MSYVVKANISPRGRIASKLFRTKLAASKYAKETNQFRQGANARVKKV